MRTALSFSILILCLVLALDYQAGVFTFGADAVHPVPPDVVEGRSVRIFTCGATLPAQNFGNQPQQNAIFVDGKMLRHYWPETGLQVVTIPPDDGKPELHRFNLARDPLAISELESFLEEVPVDTAIALAAYRTVQPKGRSKDDERTEVRRLLREIGARTDPVRETLTSWALLTLKRPQGWVPLSETFSRTKGMMIAFNLLEDRSVYDGTEPRLYIDESRVTSLLDALDQAVGDRSAKDIGVVSVGASPRRAFKLELPREPGEWERITWRYVKLDLFPELDISLGIPSDAWAHVPGARCQLLVNGEVFDTVELGRDAREPDAWKEWNVDLSPYAGQWVTLELRVETLADTLPTAVFFGRPRLTSTPSGLRPRPGLFALMARLDLNGDGIVGRKEVSEFMKLQDLDKDGFVDEDEAASDNLVSGVDRDGDGRASYEELASWYDEMREPTEFPTE